MRDAAADALAPLTTEFVSFVAPVVQAAAEAAASKGAMVIVRALDIVHTLCLIICRLGNANPTPPGT